MGPLRLKVATGLDIMSRSHDDKREREREVEDVGAWSRG